jgi:hypothetical protein
MLIQTWRFVTLLLVTLLTGLTFAHVLERPAKMLYDAGLYVTVQTTLYVARGPPNVGGILEPATILATIILAFLVRTRTPAFWLSLGAAMVLLVAFPPNWTDLRVSWERGHAIRFGPQLVALSLLIVSVLVEAREKTSRRA